ncbi:PAS domain-containing protein [Hydrogenophaga sp.]|uniref:PAS domain-containing protein n=1 Tax=Hydrogenophaga sp. TaxID=1904254 RepID=UPI00286E70D5|nr:PAS domain-containing protein [Hydrogenophaga sp.]
MSSPPWLLRLGGRHLFPLLLCVFALLTIALRYQQQMSSITDEVVQQESERLRERLSIDQSQLEQRMGADDTLVLRRVVGALALHQGLERAYLIDPLGRVRASLSRLDLGHPVTDVLARAGVPESLTGLQTAPAPHAIVVSAQADGRALSGDMPLQGEHRLLVWVDNTRAVAVRRAAVQDELVREAGAVLVAVAGLALLLHLLWFRRAQRLSRALGAMGAGDLATRAGLQGRDELADIGAAADRMAEQLRQEQERLRHMSDLINRSPAVVIEWLNQPGWPVVQVSASVRQWGYEPEQLLQGSLQYSDLIHPDDNQRIHDEVAHYFAHGPDEYRQSYRIRCADGRWAWVDDRTTLGRDAAGGVVNISGVLLDVSAQVEAEHTQRQQAELLRMFYELPFLGMAISSPTDKRWLQVNDRLCEILGYAREELLRMSWAEMTPLGDLERNVALFDELIAGVHNGYRMAKRFRRKDGRIVHTEIDVRAVRDETGRVQQLFATIQDVTERVVADMALRRSQTLLLEAQRIGRMGSWNYDVATGLSDWTDEMVRLHGWGPGLYADYLAHVHPQDRSALDVAYQAAIQHGEPMNVSYRWLRPDGPVKHLRIRSDALREEGQVVNLLGLVQDETELVEAQLARDRLVSVMETTTDIVSMADAQGHVFYFNRAGYDMLGLRPGEPLDEAIRQVHPAWAARLVHDEGIPTAIERGRWLGETAVFDAQGREVPMSQLIMAHRGADGQVEYLWSILRDVSESKAAEAALEEERSRLAEAQAVARIGSWSVQLPEGVVRWSAQHYAMLGLDPAQVAPSVKAYLAVVHPDDQARVRAHVMARARAPVDPVTGRDSTGVDKIEHRLVTPQGVRHVEERASLERDADGRVVRIFGTTMDVTERVLADRVANELRDMLEQAESVALLGSWTADAQTQRVAVSTQLFRNLGLAPADRPPSNEVYLSCVHPDDQTMVAQDMDRIRRGAEVSPLVFRTHPARGPVRVMRRTVHRITRDDQGLKPRYIGTLQDITDAVQAEEQLRQVNQELERRVAERTAQLRQANQELEAFSYTVSHDLKAPLRGIDGYSQLLVEEYGERLDEDGRQFVRRIRHGVQLMGELISDLLEYSRMERRDMAADPVPLLPLVQQVLDGYEADIHRQGAQVQLAMEPFTLALDREGMAVVLRNLIGNALKFSRDRQPPRVEIGSRSEAGRRILWVRDNGVGFDMKYHDRMFGIFQRLHRAEEFPGTGVGLALVSKAVQRMGGRVWAESTLGAGATFFLEFPE